MESPLLSWFQALQLLALGPCLFMLFFLCVAVRRFSQIFVPALYFLSLTCTFLIPLISAADSGNTQIWILLQLGKSLTPAISFLLIIQFITGRIPAPLYWAILALPLIGGGPLVYASVMIHGEVCFRDQICADPLSLTKLYDIFSSSLTFLLTIVLYIRLSHSMSGTQEQKEHQYALIVALIILNLALLALDLAQISNHIAIDRAAVAATIMRIGFIYLVLTSVFRVFDRSFEIAYDRIPTMQPAPLSDKDKLLAEKVRELLGEEKIYREMELNRDKFAARLSVNDYYLSRIINQSFDQSFSSLINEYRIGEAKERLAKETTPVTTIAFEVGFSSIASFNRVFKLLTGMSPSEYRKQQQTAKSDTSVPIKA